MTFLQKNVCLKCKFRAMIVLQVQITCSCVGQILLLIVKITAHFIGQFGLFTIEGCPCLALKHLKQHKNASVLRLKTISKWTAQVKKRESQIHTFSRPLMYKIMEKLSRLLIE